MISDEASHKFATYWVIGCIALYNFALKLEKKECIYNSDNPDPFIAAGASPALTCPPSDLKAEQVPEHTQGCQHQQNLDMAKWNRELLKTKLFEALESQQQQRRNHNSDSD